MIVESATNNSLAQKLSDFKSKLFTGKLSIQGQAGQQWYLYFYLGRVLYASGGTHGVRRWLRSLSIHCFANDAYQPDAFGRLTDISPLNEYEMLTSWEYFLLANWVENQTISREKVICLIQAIITEVIFDINQALNFTCEVVTEEQLHPQLALFDVEQICADGFQHWQRWQQAKLVNVFPDQSPVMVKPEMVQAEISGAAYATLEILLDGKRSLREISAQTRRSVLEVSTSLLPFIVKGGVSLVNIPDFVSPVEQYFNDFNEASAFFQEVLPLIAYIDDSETSCKRMADIFINAGFQFVSVSDSSKAVSTIVAKKPALIMVNSVMAGLNGYEICSYVRKTPRFQQTPIIMITANDGIVERMRSKMVGASDLVSKPINQNAILQLAHKYIATSELS
jgi:two-component system, chemotaxis family, response regulator PixG